MALLHLLNTLILFCAITLYLRVIYSLFLSPLSKIPNAHWSAPFSSLWILNKRRQHRETPTVHEAHIRLGSLVRIAPSEISVNAVEGGIRTIYSGGFEKGDWYKNIFTNYGFENMVGMSERKLHSVRKRMFSHVYAKSTLQSSVALNAILEAILDNKLIPRLRKLAQRNSNAPIYDLFSAATLDIVSAYIFGLKNATNCLEDPLLQREFFRNFRARQQHAFYPRDMPRFTRFMEFVGLKRLLVPPWLSQAIEDDEAWLMATMLQAEQTVKSVERGEQNVNPEDWPTVYAKFSRALEQDTTCDSHSDEGAGCVRQRIASELLDHTTAGFETTTVVLAFLGWELSRPKNLPWQHKLYMELSSPDAKKDAKGLDNLPILHAILRESLRLHAAIPGNQPRMTPEGASIGPPENNVSGLPANIRVQAQAWSLHRHPEVFPNPEIWDPDRWLASSEEQLQEMEKWFWPFGSGGRMCVGSNLAVLNMKAIVAAVWSTFRTRVVDDYEMEHKGGFIAEPIARDGQHLQLQVTEVETERGD